MRRIGMLSLFAAMLAVSGFAQLKMPAFEKHQLSNGITVYTLVKKDVPLVTLKAIVKGGTESVPPELAGLADITNDLLVRGTKNRSADQIALDIDFLGATISNRSGEAANEIEIEVLSKDAKAGLDILADLLLNPTFPEDEVAKELAQAIDAAKARKDSPQASLAAYATKYFYGGGTLPQGYVADELTLGRIRRSDILAYHRKQYVGANLAVIAVGDLDPAAVKAQIEAAFAGAPRGRAYAWKPDATLERPKQPRLLLVDDADSTQSYFRIMQPGIARASKDRIPLLVVNTLFGGRFTSMLNDALRVNAGLTYSASSILDTDRLSGAISISTFTPTKSTAEAIDLALQVLATLREKGISGEQLASSKAYIKGTAPTDLLETSDQLADVLARFEIHGEGPEEINALFERIDAVTLDDARRVIDTYYRTDTLTFVLLGQRSAVEDMARKYAKDVTIVEVTVPGVALAEKPSR